MADAVAPGLRFPSNLAAWRRWQDHKHAAHNVIRRLRGVHDAEPTYLVGLRGAASPRGIIGFDSHSASSLISLAEPLRALANAPVAVIVPSFFDINRLPLEFDWTPWDGCLSTAMPHGAVVLSGGHYLPLGARLHAQASRNGVTFATVQHGLMTPWAPPLAKDTALLAWSNADAAFWRSGRSDVATTTVGSQLLWNAAAGPAEHVSRFVRPVFLGQLHGAELPRSGMTRAATRFCRDTGATYRPHPSETDRLSIAQHRIWERMGIEIDRSGVPLVELQRPVVSAFSTGVLEAAARGVPAWVFYPDTPAWLTEFWSRNGMHRWGESPTPPPALPIIEPAQAIADWVKEHL
jgi:hypothetical protein